ncbi:hypothetical protein EVAR_6111_1 [Eumeta japonica]|uniref:Uncharacterized protein n=1 Tax=Eumeta variegata TaxID=151549 RepID=A0A4C1TE84_EUMVA|nr:hypothetical protein EVAR_6111_1 [Eumeta japonica]
MKVSAQHIRAFARTRPRGARPPSAQDRDGILPASFGPRTPFLHSSLEVLRLARNLNLARNFNRHTDLVVFVRRYKGIRPPDARMLGCSRSLRDLATPSEERKE